MLAKLQSARRTRRVESRSIRLSAWSCCHVAVVLGRCSSPPYELLFSAGRRISDGLLARGSRRRRMRVASSSEDWRTVLPRAVSTPNPPGLAPFGRNLRCCMQLVGGMGY